MKLVCEYCGKEYRPDKGFTVADMQYHEANCPSNPANKPKLPEWDSPSNVWGREFLWDVAYLLKANMIERDVADSDTEHVGNKVVGYAICMLSPFAPSNPSFIPMPSITPANLRKLAYAMASVVRPAIIMHAGKEDYTINLSIHDELNHVTFLLESLARAIEQEGETK